METLQISLFLQNREISLNLDSFLDFVDIFNLRDGISFNLNVVNIVHFHGWISFNLDYC